MSNFFAGANSNLGNISLLFESIGLRSVPSASSSFSFFGSSKKNVRGKKKKDKELLDDEVEGCLQDDSICRQPSSDDYVDVHNSPAQQQQQQQQQQPVTQEDVDERFEDHACQTDNLETSPLLQASTEQVTDTQDVSSGTQCEDAIVEKSFEDFGVQTDSSFATEETTQRRRSHSYGPSESEVDLDFIDTILEKNQEMIDSMKTSYVNDYLINNCDDGVGDVKKEVVEEEEISAEEEVSLEHVEWEVDRMSDGTSSYDDDEDDDDDDEEGDEGTSSRSESEGDEIERGMMLQMCGELIETQESVESDGSDHNDFANKIRLQEEEEEDERDSGTELRYDEVLNKDTSTTTTTITPSDYDYDKYVEKIKPLLYDAELVANLYIRLANKYSVYSSNKTTTDTPNEQIQHIHSAQIAYDVIKESNLTNFASVVTYLLSYLGAIKSEKPIPENASIPNLLSFLEELVRRNSMTSEHVTMLTCFLARPNRKLTPHHEMRVSFLVTCFKQELSQLNVHTDESTYLRTCFIKMCEYFVQLDMKLTKELCGEHLLPFVTDSNSTDFIMDALTYMGLVKSEDKQVVTTQDITSPLVLLDHIFLSKQMSLLTSQKLYAFIQLNNPRFKFCADERQQVANTLRKQIDF